MSKKFENGKWFVLTTVAVVVICGASYLWYEVAVSREANAQESARLRNGLVAYWSLDERNGTTANDDVSSYHGVFEGDPAWSVGKNGGALTFDGERDELALPPITLDDGTIAAWVLWNTKSVLLAGDNYNEGYWLFFEPELNAVSVNWGGKHRRFQDAFETGVWTHVAMTRRDSVLTLYKNGVLLESFEGGATAPAVVRGIGALYAGTGSYQRFNGAVDDVRVYQRALSSDEIEALYSTR